MASVPNAQSFSVLMRSSNTTKITTVPLLLRYASLLRTEEGPQGDPVTPGYVRWRQTWDLWTLVFLLRGEKLLGGRTGATSWTRLRSGRVRHKKKKYRHPVATVGETHSAGAICSSQLNYFNIAKTKHTSTFCRVQMHERIYAWVFCEVFVVRNFNFLLVWIICSHIYSFRLLMRLHLQHGIFWHCAFCIRLCASIRRLCIPYGTWHFIALRRVFCKEQFALASAFNFK